MPNSNNQHHHHHAPNRFAVIPTALRLQADTERTGRGVTIAMIDSGFYPHPDLIEPNNRIVALADVTQHEARYELNGKPYDWDWHGTQTSVVAAGNGWLSDGAYRSLASEAQVVLVKASDRGRIFEENIARGFEWVIRNKERYNIRVVSISLGGDDDVPHETNIVDQTAEEAVKRGLIVVAAAGNSGCTDRPKPVPPANSPSVITVGGYNDNNLPGNQKLDLYCSSYGPTADGLLKPEIIAPAIWVAAPILPGTSAYPRAEALSQIIAAPDYLLPNLVHELWQQAELSEALAQASPEQIRAAVEAILRESKIVATHYQHVDGTSFAAPIVASVVAQMLEANPSLTPATVKQILIATADRIPGAPLVRQGYGVLNARRAVDHAAREMHALAHDHFQPPRAEMGTLVFFYHNDAAERVALAGDFNNWNANHARFVKTADGLWRVEIDSPPPGRYHYKFVIDGERWMDDPSNGLKVPDNYGGFNSVLNVR
ncbi:MAG: S8 family serine peptidase [candidate division KSB1 bacterium]|nr:S8 family serine peptidase [candidate division KSB1 bacterium]